MSSPISPPSANTSFVAMGLELGARSRVCQRKPDRGEQIQMTDNKTEHRGDMGKVAKGREKAPETGQKGSQRTQGGHQETQLSQSSEKGKVGG